MLRPFHGPARRLGRREWYTLAHDRDATPRRVLVILALGWFPGALVAVAIGLVPCVYVESVDR
jgi:hypothetical protein